MHPLVKSLAKNASFIGGQYPAPTKDFRFDLGQFDALFTITSRANRTVFDQYAQLVALGATAAPIEYNPASLCHSSTSLAVPSVGSIVSLALDSGSGFSTGTPVRASKIGDATTYIAGQCVSYNATTGVVKILAEAVGGSGTVADWAVIECFGYWPSSAATNYCKNASCTGAVAGTPGTAPPNLSVPDAANSVSRDIVGSGSEDGIPYFDVRFYGTPSASSSIDILNVASTTAQAAASAQSWTASAFVKLAGGSLANLAATFAVDERNSSGTVLVSSSGSITPTSAALRTQRQSVSRVFNNASTAYVTGRLSLAYTSGNAVDVTIRIGAPQLEQLGFVTPPILTTGSATLARGVEVNYIDGVNFTGVFNPAEGTLAVDFTTGSYLAGPRACRLSYNNSGSYLVDMIAGNASGNGPYMIVIDGGVTQAAIPSTSVALTANTKYRMVACYKLNDFAAARNNGAVATDTSGTVQATNSYNRFDAAPGSLPLNGPIRRIRYWNTRQPNSIIERFAMI